MAEQSYKCFDLSGLSFEEIVKVQFAILQELARRVNSPFHQGLIRKIVMEENAGKQIAVNNQTC